jgi:myo-inositol catabolism protein IolC|tara:strand:+ start:1412 stop:1894 length:483 start_codon:yes stop_codon:yes gene_type:complete
MIDPITAIAGATAAFNTIKKGFAVGRDIESMAGDLGRWMGAVSDITKAEELNKKPPLFKKLFQAGSVEEEAMTIFMAKKKAEDMRQELRNIISVTRGPSAWDELIKTEADIRKKRQKAIYDQEERRRKIIEIIAICFGAGAIIAFLVTIVVFSMKAKGLM